MVRSAVLISVPWTISGGRTCKLRAQHLAICDSRSCYNSTARQNVKTAESRSFLPGRTMVR